MRTRLTIRSTILALALLTAAGCEGATDPASRREAAGIYALESVTGRGPESGVFILTRDGRAERMVHFANYPGDYVATGTFEVTAAGIVFALRESGGNSDYVWQVRGEVSGDRFTFRYPDPADGPDIVETYHR